MITNVRMTPQLAGKQDGNQELYRASLASSGSQSVLGSSSNSDSRNIEFYRPDHPFEKKLSTLDLNSTKCQKRSLNRSDVVSRHSKKASVSSSFSKKDRPSPLEIFNVARTPKENMAKTRSGL